MNICEIARKFNVSSVTVSNALNHRKGVAEKLAREIRSYAESAGYRPNYMARSLLSGRTGIVGICLCVPPSTPWYGELLCRLQLRLSEANLYAITMVLDPFRRDARERNESWALNFFNQIKAEAVLLGPCDQSRYGVVAKEYLATEKLVIFDSLEPLPCSHLMLDLSGGTEQAMQYLYDAGHRRIGYFGLNAFDRECSSPFTRFAAYRKFLETRNLIYNTATVIPAEDAVPTPETGMLLKKVLCGNNRPTALLCHNDNFATLALKVANELGFKVPEQLSVFGFDDQAGAWLTTPALTTVRFNLENYVNEITRMATAIVEKNTACKHSYCEKAELVIRDSVAKAEVPDSRSGSIPQPAPAGEKVEAAS